MAVEQLGIEFITEGFKQIDSRLDTLDKKMDGLGDTASKSGSMVTNTLAVALGNVLAKAAEVAVSSLISVGQAAIGAFGESFKMAQDFESSLANLSIAAKTTGLSMDTLHDAAIAVGGDSRLLGVSASGAAEAMTGLFKAGLSGTEVFGDLNGFMNEGAELGGALRAAIDLAAASELDMVQASDLAAIALATFGGELETEEERALFVNEALDNFVKSADASVAEVSGLADALKNVGPTAASFGFSIQDTNNALAILSTRGIQGGEAGTVLKSMMTNLMRPTDAVTGALKELNVSLFETDGTMKDLPTIIGELETAMAGMTQEQKLSYTQTLAGTYGMKAFATLVEEGTEGWYAMAEATDQATGIQEQAATKAETFAGKMEAFEGVVETLQIQIGEAFLPVATEMLEWFTGMAERYGPALTSTVGEIANSIGDLVNYILAVAKDGDTLNDWLTHLPSIAQEFIVAALAAFDQLSQWWEQYGPAIQQIATDLFDQLREAMMIVADVTLPFITRMLERFSKWFDQNGDEVINVIRIIAERFGAMAKALAKAWSVVAPILEGLIKIILDVASVILNVIEGDWEEAWQAAQNIVLDAVEGIQGAFVALADWVASWFGTSWEQTLASWSDSWEMLKQIADLAWKAIVQFFEEAGKSISGLLLSIAGTVDKAFDSISKFISSTISDILGTIDSFITSARNGWSDFWKRVDSIVQSILGAVDLFIRNLISELFEWMGINQEEFVTRWQLIFEDLELITQEIWRRVVEFVVSKVEELKTEVETRIDAVKTSFETVFGAIASFVSTKAQEIFDSITSKITAIGTWLDENIQTIINYGKTIIEGIVKGISAVGHKIADGITSIVSSLSMKAQEIWNKLVSLGTEIVSGISSGITKSVTPLFNALSTTISSAFSSVMDKAGELYKKMIDVGKGIMNGIIEGIKNQTGEMANVITRIVEIIIQLIKDRWDIGSPSRVTMSIGKEFMRGLELGVLSGLPNVIDAVDLAVAPVVQAMAPVSPTVNNTFISNNNSNFNLTTQSVVRPGGLVMEFDSMSILAGK